MLLIADQEIPYYVLPFDKRGLLKAPRTAERLQAAVADGVTDLFLFSHGWNTDWNSAVHFYRRFMTIYGRLILDHGAPRAERKTILAGIFWPSIALPSTTVPTMAAEPIENIDILGLAALAEDVVALDARADFHALAQSDQLNCGGVRRLAELLAPLYAHRDADLPVPDASAVDSIVELWVRLYAVLTGKNEGLVVSGPGGAAESLDAYGPTEASRLSVLDPRIVVRLATVLLMKDRAGVVGARGGAPVLNDLLRAAPATRIHLIGHSYGCKVALSAVCAQPLPRSVRSILLMQPALSYLAFADRLPGASVAGGYRAAKYRCELPILVTWSRRDISLRTLFQLAVRRSSDLGDQNIGAAAVDTPPSRFAAMGGWGPEAAADVRNEEIRTPDGGRYDLGRTEVLALESDCVIKAHGDVVQDATCWALYNLVEQD
ncbi:MAG: hypothetical protein LC797_23695 [Chloroflexi bacterium]|nr:hypothetical protein [Chloroflexota bacterium]